MDANFTALTAFNECCSLWLYMCWIIYCPLQTKNLSTTWSRVVLEKRIFCHTVRKLPAFHGIRRFITVLTTAGHLHLTWAKSVLRIHWYPISLRSILILPSHLRLVLLCSLFPSGVPTKILCAVLFPLMRATCLACTSSFNCSPYQYQPWRSSSCTVLSLAPATYPPTL